MITGDVLIRVLLIRCGPNTGAAFTYDIGDAQYVITAWHVVNSIVASAPIEVYRNETWELAGLELLGRFEPDIAVFTTTSRFPHDLPCPPLSSTGVVYAQTGFILGYPLTLKGGAPPTGYPIPLVRRCALSWIGSEKQNAVTLFILDGLATPGFSGGPFVFRPAERVDAPFQIGGVVLGFFPEVLPVDIRAVPRDQDPSLTVSANSGLTVCVAIEDVVHWIKVATGNSD